MKRHWLAMFVLSSVLLAASSASAVSIGTNLGFTHYLPSSGDGLSLLAVPNSGNFGLFAPGLRITQPLGTDGRQSIYFDGGLVYMSLSGDNAHTLGLLAGYQYTFSEAASAPYVTVGVGLNSSGGTGVPSTTNPVIGGGVGVLHRQPHGKGALRAELHLDREIDTDDSDASITGIGLKLGFDLDL